MSDTPRFTDTSTATPEEKARRVLQYLAGPKEHRYFHEDGYPRHPDLQGDAKAALAVFNSLAAANAESAKLKKHAEAMADAKHVYDWETHAAAYRADFPKEPDK